MEMNMGKFSEKLVGLLELAKKKKNVLEYQEINDYFKDSATGCGTDGQDLRFP